MVVEVVFALYVGGGKGSCHGRVDVFVCDLDGLIAECDFGLEFVAPNGKGICAFEHECKLALTPMCVRYLAIGCVVGMPDWSSISSNVKSGARGTAIMTGESSGG